MGLHKKDDVRQAFADRFRKALKELGYEAHQQAAMQRLFGVSGQAVRKWADGTALPTNARMPEVAAVLGVCRAWLQDGEGPMRPQVARIERKGKAKSGGAEEIPVTADEVKLLHLYRSLNPKQQTAVRSIMATLMEESGG